MIKKPKDNRYRAIFFINTYNFAAAAMSAIFKIIARQGVSVADLCVTRAFAAMICTTGYMYYYGMNPFRDLAKKYFPIVCFRAVTGFTVFAFFIYAITLMPLALHMILVQTNPFWTSVFCLLILKEQIKNFEYAAMMICFGGVACISLAKDTVSLDFAAIDPYADTRVLGIVIALAVAWGFAGLFILNRKLQKVCHSMSP